MKKTQEQKEIKAENLVDDFVKQWRKKKQHGRCGLFCLPL